MLLELLEPTETLSFCYCLMLQNICWLQMQFQNLRILSCFTWHALHIYWTTVLCKFRSHFEDVDQLIAKVKLVKSVTVKNKSRQAKFAIIGCPPQPVLTRWGSWLYTALYHAKNLSEVKVIVDSFEGSGVSLTQTKVSSQTTGLAGQLLKIKDQYECNVRWCTAKHILCSCVCDMDHESAIKYHYYYYNV